MPESGSETILVVDDEMAVTSLTNAMLWRYGYTVVSALSGAEALHLFEVWPDLHVDLALLDVVMPGIDGVELAAKLQGLRPGLQVLFISAYSEHEALQPVHVRGLPFLMKPFSSVKLVAKIREMIDGPKGA